MYAFIFPVWTGNDGSAHDEGVKVDYCKVSWYRLLHFQMFCNIMLLLSSSLLSACTLHYSMLTHCILLLCPQTKCASHKLCKGFNYNPVLNYGTCHYKTQMFVHTTTHSRIHGKQCQKDQFISSSWRTTCPPVCVSMTDRFFRCSMAKPNLSGSTSAVGYS